LNLFFLAKKDFLKNFSFDVDVVGAKKEIAKMLPLLFSSLLQKNNLSQNCGSIGFSQMTDAVSVSRRRTSDASGSRALAATSAGGLADSNSVSAAGCVRDASEAARTGRAPIFSAKIVSVDEISSFHPFTIVSKALTPGADPTITSYVQR
jgi:hypothetical protein